ncbi:hypothetical protein [Roseibium album]|uniref:hypothetical protein n=1 Tax=Roseibium album TaxID=311410 RepID=UPI0024912791|nr:hypothetical protein [Roseibium album]
MAGDAFEIKASDYRLVRLTVDAFGEQSENFYAIPNDGRALEDITLGELRAAPAITGPLYLDHLVHQHRAMKAGADQMLSEIVAKN